MDEHAQQLLKNMKPADVAEALNEKGYRNCAEHVEVLGLSQ